MMVGGGRWRIIELSFLSPFMKNVLSRDAVSFSYSSIWISTYQGRCVSSLG